MSKISQINVKFSILGAPAVGKTSLRRKYMGQGFILDYSTTLGADFANKHVQIDDTTVNLQIWDLAGQMSFIAVTRTLLAHSHAAIVVYDATNESTFDHLKAWLKILESSNSKRADRIPFIVLRNKVDLLDGDFSTIDFVEEDYIRYLSDYSKITKDNVKSIPTSAKTGVNVDLAFNKLSKILLRILLEEYENKSL